MNSTKCYIPQRGVDDKIAEQLGYNLTTNTGAFTPYRVATLRGMYDSTNKQPLDTTDINKATQQLIAFRKSIARNNARKVNAAGSNLAKSFQKMKNAFTAAERFNRVNMIATMFSEVLDQVQASNTGLNRSVILKGFDSNGRHVGGEFAIFETIYDRLMDRQARYMAVPDGKGQEQAKAISNILENWDAVTSFVRMRLRDTEGVKMGNSLEYTDEANLDNYGDNVISSLFQAEESTREGWQETNDMQSAFGSIGKQVRKLLSSLPQHEINETTNKIEIKRDDLGFPIMIDPVKAHQSLLDLLRGITSEKDMMNALVDQRGNPKQTWLIPVIQQLKSNPELRTQFFVDFKKNFQPYSILVEDKATSKNGIKNFKTKVINRISDLLGGAFMTRITLGNPLSKDSVYEKNGNINWGNLNKVRANILEWLKEEEPQSGIAGQKVYNGQAAKFYQRVGSQTDRRNFLVESSRALGIDLDADTADRIMSNSKDLRNYTRNLLELVTKGVDATLLKGELEKLTNNQALEDRNYKALINKKVGQDSKLGAIREKVDKLNTLITKNREGLKLDSRVRHKDRNGNNITLFSNVNPSYMGDKLEKIASYVKVNDKAGLKTFLQNEYLNSSFFMDGGTILNKWVEELYNACNDKAPLEESFAAKFTYQRFLGTSDISFENFTAKQQAVDMLVEFFSDRQLSKKADTALYPVFILGDSGVSKFIRAKRYNAEELLDGFYNVYRQELRRQQLVKATNEWLQDGDKNGRKQSYNLVANYSKTENTFTALPFLNKDFQAADGSVGKYASMLGDNPTESTVKKVIQEYMKEAVSTFKSQLDDLGVLEYKEVNGKDSQGNNITTKKYVYFDREAKDEASLDKALADYYWNTKFATIQQLQMMTIDPAFYNNTKNLQKRYKEIHAPGTVLNVDAIDPYNNGSKYSEDSWETCVYFDDISVDASETDKEFMQAIAAHYGEDSKIYKAYKKNTLTDGQGYRTLRGYRKVMGMAGQWTQEMQQAYEAIESIKARYGDAEIPAQELASIASMAVVFQPIKPYMFTHEQLGISTNDKQIIPVQHKYAEAVLIPELLPKGSKLRDMAYWMDNNKVDLVGSTTTVKVGGFGSTDISKAQDAKSLEDALNKAFVHQLDYKDYRIQTNVPEHINSSQLFGTQVRKLIMANTIKYDRNGKLIEDYHYEDYVGGNRINLGDKRGFVRLNGRNLVAFYNSLIVANILDSFDQFSENIEKPSVLSDKLIQGIINNSRESQDNILAYGINDEGDFNLPLFEGGLEHDSSAMALSMFKKLVNKQAIKGGSAVQVSAMGIKGYEEDGGLHYITDGDNIIGAECEIPFDFSYEEPYKDENGNIKYRTVELAYEDYCNPDGTMIMSEDGVTPKLEIIMPKATSILAYRIPTERDYSMMNLKVVRFSHKTAGGTIKVPAQGTTIAGFDFDVDKLYFMRREYVNSKSSFKENELTDAILGQFGNSDLAKDVMNTLNFEEYDYTKSPLDNTKAARNNMLIDLIQARLSDPETFTQRTTPGGFPNASKAALVMRELLFGSTEGLSNKDSKINTPNINLYDNQFYDGMITADDDAVFVFGSNAASYNGNPAKGTGGAALSALQQGRIEQTENMANTFSKSGRAYGIQTVTKPGARNSLSRKEIISNIKKMYQAAIDNPHQKFKVAYTNVGDKTSLNGYSGNQMIDMFIEAGPIPSNIMFSKEWKDTGKFNQNDNSNTSTNVGDSILDKVISRVESDDFVDPEPNYDPSDPMTIITYNQQNQVAGKLIGVFANQNTNHAFASLMKKFVLKTPIEFAGHTASQGYGYDFLHAAPGVDVDLNVAEFLAASVDAVKDPVLNFLNLNTTTANAGAVLAKLSYNLQEIGLLFNQPIIREVCDYIGNNNSDVNIAILEITNKYTKNRTLPTIDKDLSKDALARNILNYRTLGQKAMDNDSFAAGQLHVLDLFTTIVNVADEVSNFIRVSKFTASNAVGSTFGDLYAQQLKIDSYVSRFDKGGKSLLIDMEVSDFPISINKPIHNNKEVLAMDKASYMASVVDNPFAYEQAMFDMNRKALLKLNKFYPYDTPLYKNVRESLANVAAYNLDAETINTAHSDLLVYMLANEELSDFNGELYKDDTGHGPMSSREYYSNYFAKDLFNHLEVNPELKTMPIFQYMIFTTNDTDNSVNVNIQGIGGLAPYQKEAIKDSWHELHEQFPQIAKDLFLYNYFKLGFAFSPLTFMNLAPVSVKQSFKVPSINNSDRTYADYLKEIQGGGVRTNTEEFIKQFILNHLDNRRFTYEVKSKAVLEFLSRKGAYKAGFADNSFIVDALEATSKDDKLGRVFVTNTTKVGDNTVYNFRPVIKIGNDIFMVSNTELGFAKSASPVATYVKVQSLGTKGMSLQYHSAKATTYTNNMQTDSFIDGTTELVEDLIENPFDREVALDTIAEEYVEALRAKGIKDGYGEYYSLDDVRSMFDNSTDDNTLETMVNDLRTACRKDGVLMLDEDGNMLKGC